MLAHRYFARRYWARRYFNTRPASSSSAARGVRVSGFAMTTGVTVAMTMTPEQSR